MMNSRHRRLGLGLLLLVALALASSADAAGLRDNLGLSGGEVAVPQPSKEAKAASPPDRRLFSFWKSSFWSDAGDVVGDTAHLLGHALSTGLAPMMHVLSYPFVKVYTKVIKPAGIAAISGIVFVNCDLIEVAQDLGLARSQDQGGLNIRECKHQADETCGVHLSNSNCDAGLSCLAHQMGLEHKCGIMQFVYAADEIGNAGKAAVIPIGGTLKHMVKSAKGVADATKASASCLAEAAKECAEKYASKRKRDPNDRHRTLVGAGTTSSVHVSMSKHDLGDPKHCACVDKKCTPTRGANKGKLMHYKATGTWDSNQNVNWCFVDDQCDTTQVGNGHSCDGAKFAFFDGRIPSWSKDTKPTFAVPHTEVEYIAPWDKKFENAQHEATFVATGCPVPRQNAWWGARSSAQHVWDDMYAYCTLTRDGRANQRQRDFCCGAGKSCGAGLVCSKQSRWTISPTFAEAFGVVPSSKASPAVSCPASFPHLLEYSPQGKYYCYSQADGNTTGRGGLCTCDGPDCGKNGNFAPCARSLVRYRKIENHAIRSHGIPGAPRLAASSYASAAVHIEACERMCDAVTGCAAFVVDHKGVCKAKSFAHAYGQPGKTVYVKG